MNSHPTLNLNKAAALLHKGLPPADGFYWMRHHNASLGGWLTAPVAVSTHTSGWDNSMSRFATRSGPFPDHGERFGDHVVEGAYFWGPIAPPDELINAPCLPN